MFSSHHEHGTPVCRRPGRAGGGGHEQRMWGLGAASEVIFTNGRSLGGSTQGGREPSLFRAPEACLYQPAGGGGGVWGDANGIKISGLKDPHPDDP